MIQVKRRADAPKGWRIMATICFYQDIRHKAPLVWMRDVFGIGYISNRNDNITELRINGYNAVKKFFLSFNRLLNLSGNKSYTHCVH